jgi:hypothetical protein
MNKSIFKFSLDIHKPESQVLLNIKRLDASRDLHISLTENGRPYQITSDCSAVFTARKPDGNPIYNDCAIEGNVIVYEVTPQTVSCIGETSCEIRLFDNDGGLITSPRFSILVDHTIYNGEDIVESAPEFDALQNRIDKADELYDTIKSAYESGELNGKDGEKGEKGDKGDKGDSGSGLTEEQAADLEANTAARHTHENKDLLDNFGLSEDLQPLFIGDMVLTTANGGATLDALEELKRELETYVTDAINGSLDEIEAMIDESGVLDE